MSVENCYCGSNTPFSHCCKPLIFNEALAPTAERLMRSRYSAYVTGRFDYILKTYSESSRKSITLESIKSSSAQTNWLKLEILNSTSNLTTAQVEFKAYYSFENDFYLMHELSEFILEHSVWRYTHGIVKNGSGIYKQGRNDPCLCSSGKKFKKCCGK